MKIYFLGDVGDFNEETLKILNNIKNDKSEKTIILLGDNFYPGGVKSVKDPKWNIIKDLQFECQIFSVLGNHDYFGDPKSQIQFKEANWNLPNYFYKKTIEYIDFFFIDTSIIQPDYSNLNYFIVKSKIDKEPLEFGKEILAWLDNELRNSTNIKIVVGHYPICSFGAYGINKKLFTKLFPYFLKYNLKYYISGHDHNLQIIDIISDNFEMKQVVSGATSHLYPIIKNSTNKAFSEFGTVSINTKTKLINILNSDLEILYQEKI